MPLAKINIVASLSLLPCFDKCISAHRAILSHIDKQPNMHVVINNLIYLKVIETSSGSMNIVVPFKYKLCHKA